MEETQKFMYIKEFQYYYFYETLDAFKVKVEEDDKNPIFLLCTIQCLTHHRNVLMNVKPKVLTVHWRSLSSTTR